MESNNSNQTSPPQIRRPNNWRPNHPRGHNKRPQHPRSQNPSSTDNDTRPKRHNDAPRTFSQTSVITAGDKGIFVTCDKGREKKSLIELGDLIEDYIETANLISQPSTTDPTTTHQEDLTSNPNASTHLDEDDDDDDDDEDIETDIESSIRSEISTLRSPSSANTTSSTSNSTPSKPFQLITLDVPCVSFLRFHPSHPLFSSLNPTTIVHTLCNSAANHTSTIRSRHIRRLSPISKLYKILSSGLQRCVDEVLPETFGSESGKEDKRDDGVEGRVEGGGGAKAWKFAIRPTIRNNDRLGRDEVIKYVADRIQEMGEGNGNGEEGGVKKHSVDLKGYERGVLVEVYRGWVGIAVVDNADRGEYGYGYESLKRFNLAEVYIQTYPSIQQQQQQQQQEDEVMNE